MPCCPCKKLGKKQKGEAKASNNRQQVEDSLAMDNTGILYAFDFDQTCIDRDSEETVYRELLSKSAQEKIYAVSKHDGQNWLAAVTLKSQLARQEGLTVEQILKNVRALKFLTGMDRLLQDINAAVQEHKSRRLLMISGATDLFLKTVLDNLIPPVIPSHIISNHSRIVDNEDTLFVYEPYEIQDVCPICVKWLCKGNALLKYMETEGPFETVYFSGDGNNDICPATKLRECDVLFVRKGYFLDDALNKGTFLGLPIQVKATIIRFEKGSDIRENMKI